MAQKAKTKTKKAQSSHASKSTGEPLWLRQRTDKRIERRFVPKSQTFALLSWLFLLLGPAAIGAGVYGQFLRAAGPHAYALYFLMGGAVLFAVGFVLSNRAAPTLRIGDAGLGVERGDVVERLPWFEVDSVRHSSGVVVFSGAGKVVSMNLAEHPDAAAYAISEGHARIPARMGDAPNDLPAPSPDASEAVTLEPPQLAGLRCAASNRLISFEADARLCGKCGQAYHKDEVPSRCTSCDSRLV